MGGSPSHDSLEDAFSCTFKCHDANSEFYTVCINRDSLTVSSRDGKMNWIFLVSGGLILVFSGLVGADYLSTSILTDRSFVLASSGQTENGSYASRVMAADASEITRSMTGGESLVSDLSVKSSGPVLVSDYASGKSALIPDSLAFVFIRHVQG
jgi:hypothetical protein